MILKDKEKLFEITRPVTAYVTFLRQEGYERCCKYVETTKTFMGDIKPNKSGIALKLQGEVLEVTPAVEPSDVIWEN